MALQWNFKTDKIGYIQQKYDSDVEYNIYSGNALAIMVAELDSQYWLKWFFVDEKHMKNCFYNDNGSINKDFLEDFVRNCEAVVLYTHYSKCFTLAKMFAKVGIEVILSPYNPNH